jgi:glutathione S-transferase
VVNQVESRFLNQQMETHFTFLENQLKSAPEGGPYLCGSQLTAADILMSFPVIAATDRGVAPRDKYPAVNAYADKLREHEGYKKAVAKIEEIDGKFVSTL